MIWPIACQVINQALAWHGFPSPWLRKLSCSPIGDDGFSTGEYLARWGRSLIDEHYAQGRYFANSRSELMQRDLQACFADDIVVTGVGFDAPADEYIALFYVRLDPSIELWADTMGRAD
jgi:hypothetical protein